MKDIMLFLLLSIISVSCLRVDETLQKETLITQIDRDTRIIDSLREVICQMNNINILLLEQAKAKEPTQISYDGYIDKLTRRLEEEDRKSMMYSDDMTSELLKEDWVIRERIKNTRKDIKRYFEVMRDIKTCHVSKTVDTQEYVIRFRNSKHQSCEIWLHGEIVEDIVSRDNNMFDK